MKKNLTILYVEDDMDTRNIVTRILQKSYVEVLVAEDGEKGLETYLGT
ncbi:MAG TPA: response regulator, partial [Campylobacterales bacterium]|nr:response regulator [Campylobacterales bacterium]